MSDKVRNPFTDRMVKRGGSAHKKFLQKLEWEKFSSSSSKEDTDKKQRVGRPCALREKKNKEKRIKIKIVKPKPKTIKIKKVKPVKKKRAKKALPALTEAQKLKLKPKPLTPFEQFKKMQASDPHRESKRKMARAQLNIMTKAQKQKKVTEERKQRLIREPGQKIKTVVKSRQARGAQANFRHLSGRGTSWSDMAQSRDRQKAAEREKRVQSIIKKHQRQNEVDEYHRNRIANVLKKYRANPVKVKKRVKTYAEILQ